MTSYRLGEFDSVVLPTVPGILFDFTEESGVLQLDAVDPDSLRGFRLQNFSEAERADPQLVGDHVDLDNDGQTTLEEYFFGLDPKTPDTPQISFQIVNVNETPMAEFQVERAPGVGDVDTEVLAIGDLADSDQVTVVPATEITHGLTGGKEDVAIRIDQSLEQLIQTFGETAFFRLRLPHSGN